MIPAKGDSQGQGWTVGSRRVDPAAPVLLGLRCGVVIKTMLPDWYKL